jgi:hypothetical protein
MAALVFSGLSSKASRLRFFQCEWSADLRAPVAAILVAVYGWRAAFAICGLISFIMAGADR